MNKVLYGNRGIPYGVDLVDALASLVTLAAHPVPVQIGAHTVQHFTGELVLLPLLGVELEHALIHQVLSVLQHKGFVFFGLIHYSAFSAAMAM